MNRGRSVSKGMLPLLALHALSEYSRLPWKPPVTAGLLVGSTVVYLRPGVLDSLLPTVDEVLFNAHLIVRNKDLKRLFLSAFYHLSDSHLVYNMLSLLWKGIQLETLMGSAEFASMVAVLLGLSQGITLLLAKCLLFFGYESAYYYEYAAGFSGVLFALKVVLNSQTENTYVQGVMVPSRYAAWAELFLVQMFVPGVSFLGHLGGILAGILYLRLRGSNSGGDPLTGIIRGLTKVLSWPLGLVKNLLRFPRRRFSGRGTVGGSQRRTLSVWRCQTCTYHNPEQLRVCEMCGTRRSSNGWSSRQFSRPSRELSLEELRQRRVERFGR